MNSVMGRRPAIAAPLMLITGLYGMNLEWLPFAESGIPTFIGVIALMLLLGSGIVWYFRRRKWL